MGSLGHLHAPCGHPVARRRRWAFGGDALPTPRPCFKLLAWSMDSQQPSVPDAADYAPYGDWQAPSGSGGRRRTPTWRRGPQPDDATVIQLMGKSFNQRNARAYISVRLNGYSHGEQVVPEDQELLLYLLRFHHDYDSKIGPGVSHISVTTHSKGTICFQLNRVDGSSTDFSFLKCLKSCFWMHQHGLVDEHGLPTCKPPNPEHGRELPPPGALDNNTAASRGLPDDAPSRAQYIDNMVANWQDELRSYNTNSPTQPWGSPVERAGVGSGRQQPVWPPAAAANLLDSYDQDMWSEHPASSSGSWSSGGEARPASVPSVPHPFTNTPHPTSPNATSLSSREYMLALTAAIMLNLTQFKDMMMLGTSLSPGVQGGASDPLCCALTGEAIVDAADVVVGHAPEAPLKQLVVQWMQSQGFTHKGQVAVGYVPGKRHPIMLNPAQLTSWRSFHALNAELCIVSRRATAARKQAPRTPG